MLIPHVGVAVAEHSSPQGILFRKGSLDCAADRVQKFLRSYQGRPGTNSSRRSSALILGTTFVSIREGLKLACPPVPVRMRACRRAVGPLPGERPEERCLRTGSWKGQATPGRYVHCGE